MLFLNEIKGVSSALRTLWAHLCQVIYRLIAWLYELFINISQVKILTTDDIKPIYQRITMILSIIMVFYITFEFVKYVVKPELMTDKEKGVGNIPIKLLIVVVLIAFVPTIFDGAYSLQNKIFETQALSKIVLGTQSVDSKKFGRDFSANIFGVFYYIDDELWEEEKDCDGISCKNTVLLNLTTLKNYGKMPYIEHGLNYGEKKDVEQIDGKTNKVKSYYITFDGILAVGVGLFIVYILALYCIDAGVRVAQLAFLQIIAPIPIIGFLSPKKDGIFQKWYKQCLTTYLDLFIRLGIIYFVLLLCQIFGNAYQDGTILENLKDASPEMATFVYIAIIMGLLLFAKKVPKMLQELFPSTGAASGNFGLKGGERVAPMAARTIGAGLGLTRTVFGAIARGRSRHIRNKANGQKGLHTKEGRKQFMQRALNRQANKDRNAEFRAAQRIDSTKDDLLKANKELKDAEASGDQGRIAIAKQNQEKAARAYRTALRSRSGSAEYSTKRKAFEAAARDSKAAQQELAAAEASGDARRIKAAKDRIAKNEEAMKAYREFNNKERWNPEQAKLRANEASEQIIKDQNQRYRSVVGAAAWGAVAGGVTAAASGAKATKVSEIIPKVKEGVNKDIKNIEAINKYYDDGGTGFIDRAAAQVQKSLGIETAYKETMLSTKPLETKIKELDATIALEGDIKTNVDAGEDRLKEKIEDSKVRAVENTIYTGLTDANGNKIYAEVSENETLADIQRKYKGRATTAKTEAEAAAKRKEEFDKSQEASILLRERTQLSGQDLINYDNAIAKRKALEEEVAQKSKASADAEYAVTQVQKNAARYTYTQILKALNIPDPDTRQKALEEFDGPAVQRIEDMRRSVRLASQDPEIRRKLSTSLDSKTYQAFISGNLEDFDTVDRIKTAVLNAQNVHTRDKKDIQEEKRRRETSEATQAQKAANDYNGSGK